MAVKTYTEQLEEVQAALTKVLEKIAATGVQKWSRGQMSVEYAQLEALQKREEYLRPLVARETGAGGLSIRRGVFNGRG